MGQGVPSGHFWYTNFWVQTPLPPSPPPSQKKPWGGGGVQNFLAYGEGCVWDLDVGPEALISCLWDQIFPLVNFVFSHDGHFGLGRGGGGFGGEGSPPRDVLERGGGGGRDLI